MVTNGDDGFRLLMANRDNPRFFRDLEYEDVDRVYGPAPAEGPRLVDLLLRKAMVALTYRERVEARELVARAFRAPPGPAAAEPFVLGRALRLLWYELFRAVEAEGPWGEWLGALRSGLARPGDDVTLVGLAAMQAVAEAYQLPDWIAESIFECVQEYAGPDPRPPVERVLAGGGHEPDLVMDVLGLTLMVNEVADDALESRQYESEEESEEESDGAGDP